MQVTRQAEAARVVLKVKSGNLEEAVHIVDIADNTLVWSLPLPVFILLFSAAG
jgi:hypothetical protein